MATDNPIALKAPDLIKDPLPNLVVEPQRTTRPSTQNTQFAGELVYWDSFEFNAQKHSARIQWRDQDPVLIYRLANQVSIMEREQLLCGDEHTVVARYNQQVGHELTAIFQTSFLRNRTRFGDFKTDGLDPMLASRKSLTLSFLGIHSPTCSSLAKRSRHGCTTSKNIAL